MFPRPPFTPPAATARVNLQGNETAFIVAPPQQTCSALIDMCAFLFPQGQDCPPPVPPLQFTLVSVHQVLVYAFQAQARLDLRMDAWGLLASPLIVVPSRGMSESAFDMTGLLAPFTAALYARMGTERYVAQLSSEGTRIVVHDSWTSQLVLVVLAPGRFGMPLALSIHSECRLQSTVFQVTHQPLEQWLACIQCSDGTSPLMRLAKQLLFEVSSDPLVAALKVLPSPTPVAIACDACTKAEAQLELLGGELRLAQTALAEARAQVAVLASQKESQVCEARDETAAVCSQLSGLRLECEQAHMEAAELQTQLLHTADTLRGAMEQAVDAHRQSIAALESELKDARAQQAQATRTIASLQAAAAHSKHETAALRAENDRLAQLGDAQRGELGVLQTAKAVSTELEATNAKLRTERDAAVASLKAIVAQSSDALKKQTQQAHAASTSLLRQFDKTVDANIRPAAAALSTPCIEFAVEDMVQSLRSWTGAPPTGEAVKSVLASFQHLLDEVRRSTTCLAAARAFLGELPFALLEGAPLPAQNSDALNLAIRTVDITHALVESTQGLRALPRDGVLRCGLCVASCESACVHITNIKDCAFAAVQTVISPWMQIDLPDVEDELDRHLEVLAGVEGAPSDQRAVFALLQATVPLLAGTTSMPWLTADMASTISLRQACVTPGLHGVVPRADELGSDVVSTIHSMVARAVRMSNDPRHMGTVLGRLDGDRETLEHVVHALMRLGAEALFRTLMMAGLFGTASELEAFPVSLVRAQAALATLFAAPQGGGPSGVSAFQAAECCLVRQVTTAMAATLHATLTCAATAAESNTRLAIGELVFGRGVDATAVGTDALQCLNRAVGAANAAAVVSRELHKVQAHLTANVAPPMACTAALAAARVPLPPVAFPASSTRHSTPFVGNLPVPTFAPASVPTPTSAPPAASMPTPRIDELRAALSATHSHRKRESQHARGSEPEKSDLEKSIHQLERIALQSRPTK